MPSTTQDMLVIVKATTNSIGERGFFDDLSSGVFNHTISLCMGQGCLDAMPILISHITLTLP